MRTARFTIAALVVLALAGCAEGRTPADDAAQDSVGNPKGIMGSDSKDDTTGAPKGIMGSDSKVDTTAGTTGARLETPPPPDSTPTDTTKGIMGSDSR